MKQIIKIENEANNKSEDEAKKIRSDNFTRNNREKFNIVNAILKKERIRWHHNYFAFWMHQNFFRL